MLPITTLDLSDKPEYIVVCLHGLGSNGKDLMNIVPQLKLPKGSPLRFVCPDAPSRAVTLNKGWVMPAWFDIYSIAKEEREDTAGILAAESWIHEIITSQCEALGIGADKVMLFGFSQGGALSLFTALRYPQLLAGVIGLSTYMPMSSQLDESRTAANQNCPIFLAHGDQDDVVLPRYARITRQWLTQQNYKVHWNQYAMAHTICVQEMRDIKQFISECCHLS
jgi:phospholipase/carboxylesterase